MEQFIKNLARGAGAILRDGFTKKLDISHKKGHWDVVTQYDLAADKFIQGRIKKKYPKHSILSEETGGSRNGTNLWVIDPIDGTRNFSRGTPLFCTIIAFVKNNKVEYGAIYDPIRDELFYAQRGKGARLNNKAISVLNTDKLGFAMASIGLNSADASKIIIKKVCRLEEGESLWTVDLATAGLDLAYVAAGRYDFSLQLGAHPWDYAAGVLLCQEASAKATSLSGKAYHWTDDEVIVANPKLHKQILKYTK